MKIDKTDWDLKFLGKSEEDPALEKKRKQWQEATDKFVSKWKNRGDYLKEPRILKEVLDEYELWKRNFGVEADEIYYFWLRSQIEQSNPKVKAKFNKVEEFSKKIGNEMNFFVLKIAKIPKEKQKAFLESKELKDYKHFLEKIFARAKHLLSDEEEKILNLKETSAYSLWEKMVSEFLSKEERKVLDESGKEAVKGFSEISTLTMNKDKKVRDAAAEAFNDILKKNLDVAETEINAILMDKKVNDELRKFSRPDESRHLSDDIDSKIVDALVKAVSEKYVVARKYYELKAKLFGVKKLKYHEKNVEYGKIDRKYSYEDSMKLVHKVFSNLDPKFVEILERFSSNGQIDVYPKKGKRDGAFCVHFLKSQPVYVLLNHTNRLRDVETIAHEFGHAINNELMREKQNAINFDTLTSTAEVASTFMEDFVSQEIMKEADDELKLALMMQKLSTNVQTIFRQVACYCFEQELHSEFRKKGFLSKEEIGKIFQKHMKSYMGDSVEYSSGSENWWVHWHHIRTYFYVYSYASGLLISKAMQEMVKKDKKNIEKVKSFLSAGTSDSPENIFKKIGIDITKKEFWEKGLKETEELLKETEKLARKLGKI
jgi:oligoendopeptidase F